MKQILATLLAQAIDTVKATGTLAVDDSIDLTIERTSDQRYGDFATNIALQWAQTHRQSPKSLAAVIVEAIPAHPAVANMEIAGPGFINFFLSRQAFLSVIGDILNQGEAFGKADQGIRLIEGSESLDQESLFNNAQYAHARISSVLRQLSERDYEHDEVYGLAHLEQLTLPQEWSLIRLLGQYKEALSASREPNSLVDYLGALAKGLHNYYNAVQLLCEDVAVRQARICLLKATRQVLRNGLTLLGVSCPESM